jgi:hypothetical protein
MVAVVVAAAVVIAFVACVAAAVHFFDLGIRTGSTYAKALARLCAYVALAVALGAKAWIGSV